METILINTAKSSTQEELTIALPTLKKGLKGIDVKTITLKNDDRQPKLEPKRKGSLFGVT